MRKQLLLAAILLSSSVATVVVAHPKQIKEPEKQLLVTAYAESHVIAFFPVSDFACADYSFVEIPGGKLYHVESVVCLNAGFKPEVTETIRGPTITEENLLPDIRAKD